MSDLIIKDKIESKIYLIRGLNVMLDKDLALLYNVRPIALRQQVKRNRERFPEDFMFQLTEKEVDSLVSQNVIPSRKHLGGYLPYAFTENGVAMLSSVLRSERAIQVNIQIMRAFTRLRHLAVNYKEIWEKIEEMERKYDSKFKTVFEALKMLLFSGTNEPVKVKGFSV
ncbi:MAG: ORF6N domain-containing protein [Endomicrobiales bacterium]|nr:ORF6N domain-containing protein [Endomicrobiales bacterium]